MRNTNESKFYDTETDEKTVQNQDANVVQLVGQDRDDKMINGSVKYHMNIPITRQGRLTLIKSLHGGSGGHDPKDNPEVHGVQV